MLSAGSGALGASTCTRGDAPLTARKVRVALVLVALSVLVGEASAALELSRKALQHRLPAFLEIVHLQRLYLIPNPCSHFYAVCPRRMSAARQGAWRGAASPRSRRSG